MSKKMLVMLGTLVLIAALLTACQPGPQGPIGPEGPAGPAGPAGADGKSITAADLSCAECHNDTAVISAKQHTLGMNAHGGGTAFVEEYGRNSCAGCHSGNAFSEMIAAGLNFSKVEAGASEPGRQDCRTCHQIHVTYTGADWALETNAPVVLAMNEGVTFDGGSGNLCANCHQARRWMANFTKKDAAGAVVPDLYAATARFNTHYSVQADVLMGVGDAGVEGKPGAHYSMVENTCVGCHMGEGDLHTFEPVVATCQKCHADAESFDINEFVTKFEEKYAQLHDALVAKGMLTEEGATVPGDYATGPAQALFIYNLVHEDGSEGIHNPNYFNALLDHALEALQ